MYYVVLRFARRRFARHGEAPEQNESEVEPDHDVALVLLSFTPLSFALLRSPVSPLGGWGGGGRRRLKAFCLRQQSLPETEVRSLRHDPGDKQVGHSVFVSGQARSRQGFPQGFHALKGSKPGGRRPNPPIRIDKPL